jgi:dsDNA-specific endonuclease/ATPase MutS2
MKALAAQAVKVIEGYKTNKTIMNFVTTEAREKVAAEIRAKTKGGTTAKAVEILEMRHPEIKARIQEYIKLGLIGCYMASLQPRKAPGLFD